MTNNPTIDGVSRELLEISAQCLRNSGYDTAYKQLRTLLDAPSNDLRDHCKQCAEVVKTWPEWKQNCLGGAPAVERQGTICASIDALLAIDARGALVPHGIGGLARELLARSKATIAQLQARVEDLEDTEKLIQEMIDLTAKAVGDSTGLMWPKIHKAFLRDIPEMQARIAELENLPVRTCHNLYIEGFPPGVPQPKWLWYHSTVRKGTFAAPPAPVAVVLPDRKPVTVSLLSESNTHNRGWNACLDATAALNGHDKTNEVTQ